ncbi:MAG: T9SS type A sorting domain-containing protein [Bacteroidota bacterium]|nr:T9SS type A sorting domain-containing protein [Bacteroidota bacterium]
MKTTILIIAAAFILNINSYTQITFFGLEGKVVNSIRFHDGILYAGTKDYGVFLRTRNGIEWTNLGLELKHILSIYSLPENTSGFSLLAGVYADQSDGDSIVIYRLSENRWFSADSGIDHRNTIAISKIDGIITQTGEHIVYAAGECCVYKLLSKTWRRIFECPYSTGLGISPNGKIYIGGISGFEQIFFAKSTDQGNTWSGFLDLEGKLGLLFSFAFHPIDSNIIYGGNSWGRVMRSTNDGQMWDVLLLLEQFCTFRALEINPYIPEQLFAGTDCGDSALLYETTDAGLTWHEIELPEGVKGILDMELTFTDSLELYIATRGTGVYRLTQPSSIAGRLLNVNSGWNMVSIPSKLKDFRKTSNFPTSKSSAFTYNGTYTPEDILQIGKGYWLKFSSEDKFYLIGEKIVLDTFDVNAGWNMIGSISYPVVVSAIASEPPGMITTNFFTYKNDQYVIGDTIKPGIAYWVKTNQSGKLILDTAATQSYKLSKNTTIKIIPDSEMPPAPPNAEIYNPQSKIPIKFVLKQSYPNPFNPIAVIEYELPEESHVTLKIYTILGEEVITLVDEIQDAGFKSVKWDASAISGELPSGVYLYRLTAGNSSSSGAERHGTKGAHSGRWFTDVKKMIVIR